MNVVLSDVMQTVRYPSGAVLVEHNVHALASDVVSDGLVGAERATDVLRVMLRREE